MFEGSKMSEWICLAKIVGAHGIKGEVKLKSFTSNPKDVCAYGKLSDKSQTKTFALKFVGFSKDLLRVKIEGINDRNAAETLVGTELFVHRSALPELGQDTYYHSDLIGLKVVELSSGDEVGTVSGISAVRTGIRIIGSSAFRAHLFDRTEFDPAS